MAYRNGGGFAALSLSPQSLNVGVYGVASKKSMPHSSTIVILALQPTRQLGVKALMLWVPSATTLPMVDQQRHPTDVQYSSTSFQK